MRRVRSIRLLSACIACLLVLGITVPVSADSIWNPGVVGSWHDGANWSPTGEPGAGDLVRLLAGGAATVDQATAAYAHTYVAAQSSNSEGTVYVTSGGILTTGTLRVATYPGAVGRVYIDGGRVNLTDSYSLMTRYGAGDGLIQVSNGGVLNITGSGLKMGGFGYAELNLTDGTINGQRYDVGGDSDAYSGTGKIVVQGGAFTGNSLNLGYRSTGIAEISGGSFDIDGTWLLGTNTGSDGTLRIIGSKATSISATRFDVRRGPGTIEFVLDENGVTPLTVTGNLNFDYYGNHQTTMNITIGEDTPGGTYDLVLVSRNMDNFDNVDINIEQLGSARGFSLRRTTVNGQEAIQLTTDQMPEPVTIMGLLMGSAGVVGYLRRRRG